MPKKPFLLILFFSVFVSFLYAQDTLPAVNIKNFSGKIILSWKNNYPSPLKTISIQRSTDSLKFFSTIGSVLNPANFQNGFVDSKPPNPKMFYRLFIVFENGYYVFSKSAKPVVDSLKPTKTFPAIISPTPLPTPTPQQVVVPVFVPSKYVFTSKENTVIVCLPDFEKNKYAIKFYDENKNFLFQIKSVTESYLTVEKLNFKHSGWFYFDLFNGEKIIEKSKFFIAKETK